MRKDYDVEIKAMFLELNRVKEEVRGIRHGGGPATGAREVPVPVSRHHHHHHHHPGGKQGHQQQIAKKDEPRYEHPNSSSQGSSLFDYSSMIKSYGVKAHPGAAVLSAERMRFICQADEQPRPESRRGGNRGSASG